VLDRSLGQLAVHLAGCLGPRLRTGCPVVRIDYAGARSYGREAAAGATLLCAGETPLLHLWLRGSIQKSGPPFKSAGAPIKCPGSHFKSPARVLSCAGTAATEIAPRGCQLLHM
jgi:hypothetical protein